MGWSRVAPGGLEGKGASKGKLANRRYEGFLKSFGEKSQFGFIDCDDIMDSFGCDVFLHAKQKKNFNVGQAISFNVYLNQDGKPSASELAEGDAWFLAQKKRMRFQSAGGVTKF